MAQVTNTYETFDAKGIREELSNTIHKTDPEETPFMSLIGTSSISSVHPEWQTDALKAVAGYYAIREKVKLKAGDGEDGNSADFNQFSGAIHGAGQGAPDGRPAKPTANRRTNS